MPQSTDFLTGVIEGFYGRSWSFNTRFAYIDYLIEFGLNSYIYCPKGDPYLRMRWQEHWPDSWHIPNTDESLSLNKIPWKQREQFKKLASKKVF